jgi:hypothetical protein
MPTTPELKNIGFHYFPDTNHYTNHDLELFSPALDKLQPSSLILRSESSRAIPEQFISALASRGITPIIHLPLQLPDPPTVAEIKAILQAYASWGVKYVILFERPNMRDSWLNSGWSQANLVESFLDRFIPLANECLNSGLAVVFPALEPGGDYWDLSFLHNALLSLQRRNQKNLLNHLHLSAYARTYNHPLDWGQGGSERWSGNKPYATPADSQDQIGFCNYQWVQEVAKTTIGRSLPIFLLGVCQVGAESGEVLSLDEQKTILRALNDLLASKGAEGLPTSNILAANLWLFSADPTDPAYPAAWVKQDGTFSPMAASILANSARQSTISAPNQDEAGEAEQTATSSHPIKHYLLLPVYDWGVADWHLDVIKPFVRKHQPTIGFSLQEAALAEMVTVIGGTESFSEDALTELRSQGCRVERISGDGTSIATQLTER